MPKPRTSGRIVIGKEGWPITRSEQRQFLIRELLDESPRYRGYDIPAGAQEQRELLRGLMNVRMPRQISKEFLAVQDAYLKETIAEKGITRLDDLTPVEGDLYLWQGDITTLECDAVVNAANSGMTGCYRPCHNCIDNTIPYLITHPSVFFGKASA